MKNGTKKSAPPTKRKKFFIQIKMENKNVFSCIKNVKKRLFCIKDVFWAMIYVAILPPLPDPTRHSLRVRFLRTDSISARVWYGLRTHRANRVAIYFLDFNKEERRRKEKKEKDRKKDKKGKRRKTEEQEKERKRKEERKK